MTEYISKQVQINKADVTIYQILSSFDNFTPILKDHVEGWNADCDSCSFKVKGFELKLKMIEKEPSKTIKITGDNIPFEFYFWIQLKSMEENDTRLRLTIKTKLNAMMKMMIGNKLQKGLDDVADRIAYAFNNHIQ